MEGPGECINEKSSLIYVSHDSPGIDQAVLMVTSAIDKKLILCAQSDVCYKVGSYMLLCDKLCLCYH